MFLPFSLLFFLATTPLSLTRIGLGLSIAAIVRIPVTIAAGPASDRFGPRAAIVSSQLLQAAGFAGYLLVHGFWQLVAATVLCQAGNSIFWVAYPPLIFAIAGEGEREHWFALVSVLQGAGAAAGGVIAGATVALGGHAGFIAVAAADAASYVLAAVLCMRSRAGAPGPRERHAGPGAGPAGGWGPLLRDRPFLGFVALSMGLTFLAMACMVALPVFLVKILGLPAWAPGTALGLTAVLVTFSTPAVMSAIAGHRRHRVLMASQSLMIVAFAVFLLLRVLPAGMAIALALVAVVPLAACQVMQASVVPAIVTESAGPASLGRYTSAYQLTFSVADIIVPVVVSATLHPGAGTLWLLLAAIAVADVALVAILARRMTALTRRVGQPQPGGSAARQLEPGGIQP
jgi:MFS family permease